MGHPCPPSVTEWFRAEFSPSMSPIGNMLASITRLSPLDPQAPGYQLTKFCMVVTNVFFSIIMFFLTYKMCVSSHELSSRYQIIFLQVTPILWFLFMKPISCYCTFLAHRNWTWLLDKQKIFGCLLEILCEILVKQTWWHRHVAHGRKQECAHVCQNKKYRLKSFRVEQDRQCTCSVPSRSIRAAFVAVGKLWVLHNLSVCICSLRYPACKVHVPYFLCGLSCCAVVLR
jgi:hypothetical protein